MSVAAEPAAFPPDGIVGRSPAVREAVQVAHQCARSADPVLIVGETGTGKELLARLVHEVSGVAPFVDVDCGALALDLVEAELFGHRRGSFTGATTDRAGLIENADGGTLFLDELSNLPLSGQQKLLRVLETREFRRVGETGKRRADFRLIASMQDHVLAGAATGEFRFDLLQRLAGVVIALPPLRDRCEDVIPLAKHFAAERGRTVSSDAARMLVQQPWPGNVRELRSTVRRAGVFAATGVIDGPAVERALDHGIGPWIGRGPSADPPGNLPPLALPADPARRRLIEVCIEHRGDVDRIASRLQISRATLYRRLQRHRLLLSDFRLDGPDRRSAPDRSPTPTGIR